MSETAERSVHGFVRGLVQGVNYRRSLQREAEEAGLAGWVRNLPDGRVEFAAQGPADGVERLLAWARRGPWGARVAEVDVADRRPSPDLASFEIHPTPR
jgi:acylphosphatase